MGERGNEGLDYIVDIGVAYDVLMIIFDELYDKLSNGNVYGIYRDILKKTIAVPKAIPILKPENIKALDEFEDIHEGDLIVVLELHAGNIRFGPYQQIDNDGDEIGSMCLTRGKGWLKNYLSEICNKYRGVVIDLCDYFACDPRDRTLSCLCDSCLVELKKYVNEQLDQGVLRDTGIELSTDEVIEEVRKGLAIRAAAKIRGDGWTPLTIPPRLSLRDILQLPKLEEYRSNFLEVVSKNSTDRRANFEKALASYVLFARARSIATARNIIEVLSGLSCYKGVTIEHTGSYTLTLDVVEELSHNGIDVWIDRMTGGARYHNMPRSRYLLGQLNESLFSYMLRGTLGARSDAEGKELLNKIMLLWGRTIFALSRAWIPDPDGVRGTGLRCAVFGWPKEVVYLMHHIINIASNHDLDLKELGDARRDFMRLIQGRGL